MSQVTLQNAKDYCKPIGISLTKRNGEYRIAPDAYWLMTSERAEAMAAYETDLDSALGTAEAMSTWMFAHCFTRLTDQFTAPAETPVEWFEKTYDL